MARIGLTSVQLSRLSKIYPGGIHAVRDFSLEVDDREFLVLVGPSGCGKSTLLRMIAGLEVPSDGTICMEGRPVNNVPPRQRNVAMVFQSHVLYPHMNVRENLAFPLRMRRHTRSDTNERVRRVAEQLALTELLDRMPATLSGGQRQRVALGRAMVWEPRLFLFDEPLSNLDAYLRVRMRAELKQLHAKSETTTIHVTHDQEEALSLGHRVAVMSDGMLHQCDTPNELVSRPANRFVAEFIGSPPMSFVEGTLTRDSNGRLQFVSDGVDFIVTEHQQILLERYQNQRVAVGFRPKLFSRDGDANSGESFTINAAIASLDCVGDQFDHHLILRTGNELVARLDREQEKAGDTIRLYFPKQRAEFFAASQSKLGKGPVEGRNLLLPDET